MTHLLLALALAALPEPVTVFATPEGGFQSIRIPSLVVAPGGALLAFAEGRAANADQAKNKLILKRSLDGGQTWGALQVVADGGERSLNNPCAVVDAIRKRVLLVYQAYPPGVGERSAKLTTGYDGDFVVRNFLVTSGDDGVTWSPPRDITRQTKRESGVTTLASGPGVGIQLREGPHAGRLLVPFNEGPFGQWNVYAAISDDGGASWSLGEAAPGGFVDTAKGKLSAVNEVQFAELPGGAVVLNARHWGGKPVRKTARSGDGGKSWSQVVDAPGLPCAGCMGSVLARGGRLYYTGPAGPGRKAGTLFVSADGGATWPTRTPIVAGGFAYSCLAPLPGGALGCLYEPNDARRVLFLPLPATPEGTP